jgi:hypothetical protein
MLNNAAPLKLYPRGFLGKPLEARFSTKRRLGDSQYSGLPVSVKLVTQQMNSVDANPTVEALYGRWINRAPATTAFEFRKQVLNAALDAFGTDNFFYWYTAQAGSPAFGDLHRDFMEDTLHYIQTGQRKMCLENWQALLTTDDSGERSEELSSAAKAFFGIKTPEEQWRSPQYRRLDEVIQKWCSQPTGFEDLLSTLHVLFGNY